MSKRIIIASRGDYFPKPLWIPQSSLMSVQSYCRWSNLILLFYRAFYRFANIRHILIHMYPPGVCPITGIKSLDRQSTADGRSCHKMPSDYARVSLSITHLVWVFLIINATTTRTIWRHFVNQISRPRYLIYLVTLRRKIPPISRQSSRVIMPTPHSPSPEPTAMCSLLLSLRSWMSVLLAWPAPL